MIHNTDPCYPTNDQKNILLSNATPIGVCRQNAECRLFAGGVGLSFLDRSIFLHSSLTNRSLLLQQRTGHLRAQVVETHVYSGFIPANFF